MKKVARHIVGWFFIVLGIIGLFLPILQGVLFILVGMFILARDVPLFHRMLSRLKDRYPVIFEKATKLHVNISNWWREKLTIFGKGNQYPDEDGRGDKHG